VNIELENFEQVWRERVREGRSAVYAEALRRWGIVFGPGGLSPDNGVLTTEDVKPIIDAELMETGLATSHSVNILSYRALENVLMSREEPANA
jgi:hypothetical protein